MQPENEDQNRGHDQDPNRLVQVLDRGEDVQNLDPDRDRRHLEGSEGGAVKVYLDRLLDREKVIRDRL